MGREDINFAGFILIIQQDGGRITRGEVIKTMKNLFPNI